MRQNKLLVPGVLAVSAVLAAASAAGAEAKAKKKPEPHRHHQAAAPHGPVTDPGATRSLGTEGAWSAYEFRDKSGRVCYLVSRPEKSSPANARRKPPSAMVTHRPDQNVANVVSFAEGYPLKEGSEVVLDTGGTKYELFTRDDSAWARTADLDKAIVTAFTKARDVSVKGTPHQGPATVDTYSLKGFAKALGLIDKACGVKR
jgi:hypothetical protein